MLAWRQLRPRRPPTLGDDGDARDVPGVSTLAPRTDRDAATDVHDDAERRITNPFDFGRSRAVSTRAKRDRSAHDAMEWACKCADVEMETREAERARGGRGAMKANRWFNAATPRRRETTRVVTGEDEDGKGAEDGSFGRGGRFRERVVVLDVFLEREMSSKDGDEGAPAPRARRDDARTRDDDDERAS